MGLVERVALARRGAPRGGDEQRFSIDNWISDYLLGGSGASGFVNSFGYGGNDYPLGLTQTYNRDKIREFSATLPGYTAALRSCPPAFAAQMVRALVLSQARFTFRNPPWHPRTPRRQFGTPALGLLERPWPNGTTGELVSRMEWHAGLAGNSFVRREAKRLRVMRPDYTAVVHGSQSEPDDPRGALDAELVGYVYQNGGIYPGNTNRLMTLPVAEVAHWSPIPDPESPAMGLSWITAALRDIQGDIAATEHKLKFFSNGATPNMVVKGIPAASKAQFDEIVDMMEESNGGGIANAYKTLYLTAGADATVVGSNLQQLDFKATQGAGETRIALLGRVPAPLLGISEGLAGSSLNAGNFGMARRLFSDIWVHPTLQDLAAALAPVIDVPADAELWFDTADIPLLREDGKDAAEIEQTKAGTIETLIRAGFTPDSAVLAVTGQNPTLLTHTGFQSVQMQSPAPDAGLAQVVATKATAMDTLVKAGFTPESVIEAVDAFDMSKLNVGELVPKVLIEDPTVVGAEPGVQAFPAGPDATAPANPATPPTSVTPPKPTPPPSK